MIDSSDVLDSVCKICVYLLAIVSPSDTRKKLHSRKLSVVVHVNSNLSPWHTDAVPKGDSYSCCTYMAEYSSFNIDCQCTLQASIHTYQDVLLR